MSALHDTLANACEHALVAGARSARAGTRQQVRAAARRFVRRHHRDASYLRFVLRSVAASSTLAVALLGLGAAPVHAKATLFTPLGAADPLAGQDVGLFSAPVLGDLDDDGDLDLVSGTKLGGFAWFENTGSAASAAYVARSGAQNPLDGEDVGLFSAPTLADLDGDGDLDLVAGEQQGGFFYFENTGNANAPAFIARTGAANPLAGQGTDYGSAPVFADLDDDGDLDLVAGDYDGTFFYFENTGSTSISAFVARTGAANPLDGLDVGYYSSPAFGDLDDDGDLDLLAGRADGELAYFENTGSAASTAFAALLEWDNPLDSAEVGAFSTAALGDLDGDGDLDLVSGDPSGLFTGFENRFGHMVQRSGANNPFDFNVHYALYDSASFGDLDGDGDLDLVLARFGTFDYYENTGSVTAPAFVRRTGAANPLTGQDVGFSSAPALGDVDGDGDLDLVSGTQQGIFAYIENTGSATSAAFISRTGAANPLDGQDAGIDSTPALGDLDGDGDLDLVAGVSGGTFRYYENTGSPTSPAFVARTGSANPLDGVDLGIRSAPAQGDVDGDGDGDLVLGGTASLFAGVIRYFENTGSPTTPDFVMRTGATDPFGDFTASDVRSLALVDLDGDGDFDVKADGRFLENAIVPPSPSLLGYVPEPGQGLLLGAGVALLAWLRRLRGCRR